MEGVSLLSLSLTCLVVICLYQVSEAEVTLVTEEQTEQEEGWSVWSESSACSRSCGGGVTFQQRICLIHSVDGVPECDGPTVAYRSCNIQECPPEAIDFRMEQCQRHNHVPLEGVYYEWEPYYSADVNQCELNCLAVGQDFFYRHAAQVLDGTQCHPGTRDVCVEGVCQPVGCDGQLGSGATFDRCHRCGPQDDGQICSGRQGIIPTDQLSVGYHQVLDIPAGATTIVIEELSASDNFLALRDAAGNYLLNAPQNIDPPHPKYIAGTTFHYHRRKHPVEGPEKLSAQGPTTEILYLEVLRQADVDSADIAFEFHFLEPSSPIEPQQPQPPPQLDVYEWTAEPWGLCSQTCDNGVQIRRVLCQRSADQLVIDDANCDPATRPAENQHCNLQPCGPSWSVGNWEHCSTTCGAGFQARSVVCHQPSSDANSVTLHDTYCSEPRPDNMRPCNEDVECPLWETSDWSQCNRVCGPGEQFRQVFCRAQQPLPHAYSDILPESFCELLDKPTARQDCNVGPCQGLEWVISEWTGCEGICGHGMETRQVVCSTIDGQVFSDDLCDIGRKPATVRSCSEDASCQDQPKWHASQWSQCSAQCGPGVQMRRVVCARKHGVHLVTVDDSECDPRARMTDHQDCEGTSCAGIWFSGPWGKCSQVCGGGQRKRQILCFSENEVVDTGECDPNDRPDSTADCNQEPCDEDNLLPVDNCRLSEHGCCPDGITAAEGENFLGCPPKDPIPHGLCIEAEFGCCLDGITPALGPFMYGCPEYTCKDTRFGCCSDGQTPALGPAGLGCPQFFGCTAMAFGCCPDGVTPANGLNGEGCEHLIEPPGSRCESTPFGCCPDGITPALGPDGYCGEEESSGEDCSDSPYGCCEDGATPARGPNQAGCNDVGTGCTSSPHGCCPDGISVAQGPQGLGCLGVEPPRAGCAFSPYGCCPDGETPAPGPDQAGCPEDCVSTIFGCCPDGITPALGRDHYGCPSLQPDCMFSSYGCCRDGVTFATGDNYAGCHDSCDYYPYGCCPDGQTVATGPDYEGCNIPILGGCESTQYGCCPGSDVAAQGPEFAGCYTEPEIRAPECDMSEFGCCLDGRTAAQGENFEGCDQVEVFESPCALTDYGCCTDGVTPASGPNNIGCPELMEAGSRCGLPSDTGPGRNYSVQWYFDPLVGDCSRFWYGGEQGNGNRFFSQEECKAACIKPEGIAVCYLPKSTGRCRAAADKFYFNPMSGQCETFTYGGCYGNDNRFDSVEGCQEKCGIPHTPDVCSQPHQPGPCRGQFERWFYDRVAAECKQFIYGGCKGNGNRFESRELCEQRCQQPATHVCQMRHDPGPCEGEIPRWFFNYKESQCQQFAYGGCHGNANRFENREHCEQTCHELLQKRVDRCTLPSQTGPCRASMQRWYHDSSDGYCKQFIYGGCDGNENNFESETDCRQACNAHPPVDVCSLAREPGPCEAYLEKYYFDQDEGRCKMFVYGGCEGNENRFDTREECHKQCPEVATQPESDRCKEPRESGPCLSYLPRWYFDGEAGVCAEFIYGGCGGNKNRFISESDCNRACRPEVLTTTSSTSTTSTVTSTSTTTTTTTTEQTRPESGRKPKDVCSLPKSPGPCYEYSYAWHYDTTEQKCLVFIYGGCEGNDNRFSSPEECEAFCMQEPEPEGEVEPEAKQMSGLAVCALPSDPGHCREYEKKWYFDTELGGCREFQYGGCAGNENRFETQSDCEAACPVSDICKLPAEAGPCKATKKRFFFDETSGKCKPFTYGGCDGNANRFLSMDNCNKACTTMGPNVPETRITNACDLPADGGMCRGYFPMWYYDSAIGRCAQFVYGGCQGNDNRFDSEESCEEYCTIITTPSPTPTQPEGETCTLQKDTGPCREFEVLWYFDTETGSCLRFWYGGCKGNSNRFPDRDSCQAACLHQETTTSVVVPVTLPSITEPTSPEPQTEATEASTDATDVCALPKDQGPCEASMLYYYFNTEAEECQEFNYGGCGGNSNRFQTVEECRRLCGGADPREVTEAPVEVCKQPKESGPCFADFLRYYFDEVTGECRPFVFGGCQGNDNNFETQEECYQRCGDGLSDYHLFKPGDCYEHPDAGPCEAAEPRWYFDSKRGDCLAFYYGGCDGNGNNFRSYDECSALCSRVSVTCGVLQCNLECENGFARGRDGCLKCECYDPCSELQCPDSMVCVVEQIQCVREPCPGPQAKCRPRPKSGQCPVPDPDLSPICDEQCREDHDCPQNQKCCSNGCGRTCTHPKQPGDPDVKPGLCPGNDTMNPDQLEVCEEMCTIDTDCPDDGKCCPNGCGFICMPALPAPGCVLTTFGCCPDGITPSEGYNFRGCPEEEPSILGEDGQVVAVVSGEGITLECRVHGAPLPQVTWFRETIPILKVLEEDNRFIELPDGSLQLVRTKVSDAARYTCRAFNGVGQPATKSYNLQVHVPVTFDAEALSELTVTEGEEAMLLCGASGIPPPHIQWIRADAPVVYDGIRITLGDDDELNIDDVTQEDAGEYVCLATNGVGQPQRHIISVTVQGPLAAEMESHPGKYMVGDDARLMCHVFGGGNVTVTWQKNGAPLAPNKRFLTTAEGELLVDGLIRDDAGNYTCTVRRNSDVAVVHTQIVMEGVEIPEHCTDMPWFANCKLITEGRLCRHEYFSKFCCLSCYEAGLLP